MMQVDLPVSLINIFSIFDAESLIRYGGLLIACLLVYGTTGLFFCFFLPSGAVLFAAGMFTATGSIHYGILAVCGLLTLASILGTITGYWFGWKAGLLLYKRKDTRFFRQQHLKTADAFYAKYGWLALTAGLFLPVIRTFAPIIAGIIRLNFRRFILLVIAGSIVWVSSFTLIGYFIGSQPALKAWLKYIVVGFILIVTLPLVIRMVKEWRKLAREVKNKK